MCTPQIIDYKLVEGWNRDTLVKNINQEISNGYEPFGSIQKMDNSYFQPMVLYRRPEPKAEPPLITEVISDIIKKQKPG